MPTFCRCSFNPHPARRLDAIIQSVYCVVWKKFQSSSSPKAGCNSTVRRLKASQCLFQSSSSPKAGCNANCKVKYGTPPIVSILIQPEGWMQFCKKKKNICKKTFQSSSSPKAGCNCPVFCNNYNLSVFQSSSSPKAGCNVINHRLAMIIGQVSILIQPEGWMQYKKL